MLTDRIAGAGLHQGIQDRPTSLRGAHRQSLSIEPARCAGEKRDAFLLFILWNIFARRTVGMTRIRRREVTKESRVTRSHVTLAIAIAVSLGIVRPDAPPTREIPLSKSDIVIAADDHGAIDHPREEEKAPSVPSD